jgi:hypothetical protein
MNLYRTPFHIAVVRLCDIPMRWNWHEWRPAGEHVVAQIMAIKRPDAILEYLESKISEARQNNSRLDAWRLNELLNYASQLSDLYATTTWGEFYEVAGFDELGSNWDLDQVSVCEKDGLSVIKYAIKYHTNPTEAHNQEAFVGYIELKEVTQ